MQSSPAAFFFVHITTTVSNIHTSHCHTVLNTIPQHRPL